jgi:hypothetical protein
MIDPPHVLSLRVVAEGVEAAKQLACLSDMRYDLAQGGCLLEPRPGESWRVSWQKTLRTEVSLGAHLALTAASRRRHTRSLQSLIEILRRSPTCTNPA